MPPVPSTAPVSGTPRLVLYQQTHHTPAGEAISILPLVTQNTGITHLYIAAIHLNDGPGNITLNDHKPDDSRYQQLWGEVRWLQGAGIKVMAMLGGAAKGSYERLSGDDASFEAYYSPLAAILRQYEFQGIDLDIEEPMALAYLERLILRLKQDFGDTFIITLAPVAAAMLPLRPYMISLVRRLLMTPPSQWENIPEIIKAFLKPSILKSNLHLSGFNHFELEMSPAGQLVDWYNVQMYNGWGDAHNPGLYRAIIDCGWKPERIVLGVLTNPGNGGSGHVDCDHLKGVISQLRTEFGQSFGGLMGWEYFNAGEERGSIKKNWQWVKEMGETLDLKSTTGATTTATPTPADATERQPHMQAPASTTASSRFPEEDVLKLIELGFERPEALAALEAMDGDVEQAATIFHSDN